MPSQAQGRRNNPSTVGGCQSGSLRRVALRTRSMLRTHIVYRHHGQRSSHPLCSIWRIRCVGIASSPRECRRSRRSSHDGCNLQRHTFFCLEHCLRAPHKSGHASPCRNRDTHTGLLRVCRTDPPAHGQVWCSLDTSSAFRHHACNRRHSHSPPTSNNPPADTGGHRRLSGSGHIHRLPTYHSQAECTVCPLRGPYSAELVCGHASSSLAPHRPSSVALAQLDGFAYKGPLSPHNPRLQL